MFKILLITILIIIFVLVIFSVAISKGYSYKHTVDPIDSDQNHDRNGEDEDKFNG
ncbi:YtzI protein [Pseudalkalibacillus decolorationis]|uniref:YtzI protein n=1 Tax=Pseudalkalibacillus decolorationis TaxID=163879 RepID=UPI002147CD24|nr:YtzI protein [Pseudalkalibacillus decolorationis]